MQCASRGNAAGRSLAVGVRMTRVISITSLCVGLFSGVAFGYAQTAAKPTTSPTAIGADRVLAVQVALDRAGFSPGEIDGKGGKNTDAALRAYQTAQGLPATGELDAATMSSLGRSLEDPLTTYTVSAEDRAGPFVKSIPEDMVKKAALPALGYASIQELLGERFHASPALLARLNPGAQFQQGDVIQVPNVDPFILPIGKAGQQTTTDAAKAGSPDAAKAANIAGPEKGKPATATANTNPNLGAKMPSAADAEKAGNVATPGANSRLAGAPTSLVITVTDATKTLTVEDGSGKMIFYAPVTVGSTNDPLPVGEWKVNGVQRSPSFNYNPDLFWDANPAHTKAKLAAGPNNPVGTIWIDLNKEHYGIHGTPEPSRIGYTESHGCIRLTNWDATRLAALVGPGTKVILR
jgi:lipoprotein-anchoring transpeptidase ErfK/SrfK